jgi:hypothetical protein
MAYELSYWIFNYFGGRFLLKATWNYGKEEWWSTGHEKRNALYLLKLC